MKEEAQPQTEETDDTDDLVNSYITHIVYIAIQHSALQLDMM